MILPLYLNISPNILHLTSSPSTSNFPLLSYFLPNLPQYFPSLFPSHLTSSPLYLQIFPLSFSFSPFISLSLPPFSLPLSIFPGSSSIFPLFFPPLSFRHPSLNSRVFPPLMKPAIHVQLKLTV
uniref:Uncharacterized protein n=1 Tax=Cacopsylla melanoneura TaxID=428564 RepID=A0A8D8PTD9_9HEMI